ncbi:hypothetical protein GCM10027360_15740 [Amycolatopsis echigonensis]
MLAATDSKVGSLGTVFLRSRGIRRPPPWRIEFGAQTSGHPHTLERLMSAERGRALDWNR